MKRDTVKKMISAVLAATMVFSLAACGKGDTSDSGGETGGGKSGDVTIRVATRYSTDIADDVFYRSKVEEFNAMDNGITVEMDNISTESDYLDKLRTSFANGDTPNAFIEYGGSRVLDYVESDAVVDIQPYLEEDPEWHDAFYESMFDQLHYEEFPGQTWGIPFKSYVISLYYNTEIFKEQGLEVPKNWDELLAVCEKLAAAGIQPFQVGEKDAFRLGHFHNNIVIKSLGAEAAEKLAGRSIAYDSTEMIETYQKIADLNEKGFLGVDILNMDYTTEKVTFLEGNCAMHWDGSWFVAEVFGTDIYDKVDVADFPAIDEKFAKDAQGGPSDMWYVSKLNKSEEEINAAIEFVKFMTTAEYFAELNEVASVVYPVQFKATEKTPENPLLDHVNELLSGYTSLRTDLQTYDTESHMLDTVRNALQGLAMGNTAEEVGTEITDRMKEYSE